MDRTEKEEQLLRDTGLIIEVGEMFIPDPTDPDKLCKTTYIEQIEIVKEKIRTMFENITNISDDSIREAYKELDDLENRRDEQLDYVIKHKHMIDNIHKLKDKNIVLLFRDGTEIINSYALYEWKYEVCQFKWNESYLCIINNMECKRCNVNNT